MSLLDYIRGNRKGKDAHGLEKESMQDPFLYEALEGFDTVDDDHIANIANIQQRIQSSAYKAKQSTQRVQLAWKIAIAASLIFIAIVGKELIDNSPSNGLQAQSMTQMPIELYVPADFYQENIAVIAYKNTELTKEVSVVTFKNETLKDTNEKEDDKQMKKERIAPIEIYTPTE